MPPLNGSSAPSSSQMVSDLPLLFVRGNLKSLETMKLAELQIFFRFLLKCETKAINIDLDNIKQPMWWPGELQFSNIIFQQQSGKGKLSSLLRRAIRKCYSYHNCSFLIEYCEKLITFAGGVNNLQIVDHRNGTRSLYKRGDKKCLVTFRSENQDYDKQIMDKGSNGSHQNSSPTKLASSSYRKCLSVNVANNTSDPALSQIVELFLCDSCDRDFDSLADLMVHEKVCDKNEECLPANSASQIVDANGPSSGDIVAVDANDASPMDTTVDGNLSPTTRLRTVSNNNNNSASAAQSPPRVATPHGRPHRACRAGGTTSATTPQKARSFQNLDKHQMANYLRLCPVNSSPPQPRQLKDRPRASSYDKFVTIDISSPLGKYILTSSNLTLDQQNPAVRGYQSISDLLQSVESRCPGTIQSIKNTNAWLRVKTIFKETSRRRKPLLPEYHKYCFTQEDRIARRLEIEAGLCLSSHAHWLWRRCRRRPVQVRLERLPPSMLEAAMLRSHQRGLLRQYHQRQAAGLSQRPTRPLEPLFSVNIVEFGESDADANSSWPASATNSDNGVSSSPEWQGDEDNDDDVDDDDDDEISFNVRRSSSPVHQSNHHSDDDLSIGMATVNGSIHLNHHDFQSDIQADDDKDNKDRLLMVSERRSEVAIDNDADCQQVIVNLIQSDDSDEEMAEPEVKLNIRRQGEQNTWAVVRTATPPPLASGGKLISPSSTDSQDNKRVHIPYDVDSFVVSDEALEDENIRPTSTSPRGRRLRAGGRRCDTPTSNQSDPLQSPELGPDQEIDCILLSSDDDVL